MNREFSREFSELAFDFCIDTNFIYNTDNDLVHNPYYSQAVLTFLNTLPTSPLHDLALEAIDNIECGLLADALGRIS